MKKKLDREKGGGSKKGNIFLLCH